MCGQPPSQAWRPANSGEDEDESSDLSDLDHLFENPPLPSSWGASPQQAGSAPQPMGPPADQVQYDTIMGTADTAQADRPEARLAPGERPAPTRQNLRYFTEWWGYYVDDGPKRRNEKQYDYNWRIKRARVNMGIEMRVLPDARTGNLTGNAVYNANQYVCSGRGFKFCNKHLWEGYNGFVGVRSCSIA